MPQRFSEMEDIVVSVLDTIPSPIFLVDDDVQILGYNLAASILLAQNPETVISHRAGRFCNACMPPRRPVAVAGRKPVKIAWCGIRFTNPCAANG